MHGERIGDQLRLIESPFAFPHCCQRYRHERGALGENVDRPREPSDTSANPLRRTLPLVVLEGMNHAARNFMRHPAD